MTARKKPEPAPRDITDLARDLHHAWITACAAVPFPEEMTRPGVTADTDPACAALVGARLAAFDRASEELVRNHYVTEPWMITALSRGDIPCSSDGAVPGGQVIAPEGVQHHDPA